MSGTRLLAMARKEWLQIRRDPRSMALAFILPLVMVLLFGYAITWDVRDLELVVMDLDRTPESRSLVDAFQASGYFRLAGAVETHAGVDRAVGRGDAGSVLRIPPGFARDLAAHRPATVQLLLDGSDANSAIIAYAYAEGIVASWGRPGAAQLGVAGSGGGPAGAGPPIQPEVRIWYNPTLASRNMIVPGLIGVIMMTIAAMLTALTVAREWERGTMEQLAATPVTRWEMVLGKLIPYLFIGLGGVAVTAVAGLVVFGVPFRGSVLLFLVQTMVFLVGALGLGVLISAAAKSQFLATQLAMLATLLPAMLLSGFLFEIRSMPTVLQGITYLVPARYYITATRGVMLKGVGVEALWVPSLFMVLFAVGSLFLARWALRKEVA
jgi:ABC-2 type transport system permease protein